MDIKVNNRKDRKDGSSIFFTDGHRVFLGKDYARDNEIQDAKRATQARSCFRECRSCGSCANSRRDATYPKSYDANAGKSIDCRGCEPNRFHDCHNGIVRDSRGEAEPFTEEAQKLIDQSGGKPLM